MPSHPADGAPYDVLPDGVVIAGADGVVTHANRRAARLLAGDPDASLTGRPLAEALALQDKDSNDWVTCNRPYQGLATVTGIPEQAWMCPDGTEVLTAAQIDRHADGAVRSVAITLRSARGRARLDRERSDLVATVAHELRSPLTGVKGFVMTLLSKWDRLNDEQKKLMLTTVSTDSERLSRLITELLDVARIDTGRLPLHPREIELAVVVDRVVELVRAGTARTIVVEHQLEHEGLRSAVHADPDKLVQVVTNLVDNAVKHGEGVVRVTTGPGPLGIRLVVDDEGEGIPEELRTRVFTKFWRHGARGGTGLGMYIVNGLVRVHDGELTIDDAPGGGARITVDLPASG